MGRWIGENNFKIVEIKMLIFFIKIEISVDYLEGIGV